MGAGRLNRGLALADQLAARVESTRNEQRLRALESTFTGIDKNIISNAPVAIPQIKKIYANPETSLGNGDEKNIEIEWNPIDVQVAYYEVEVALNRQFGGAKRYKTTDLQYLYREAPTNVLTWYFRIRAVTPDNRTSNWSRSRAMNIRGEEKVETSKHNI